MRHHPRGERCTWSPARAVKSLLVLGYPDVYARRRPRRGDPRRQADRPGGDRRRPRPRHEEEGHPPERHHAVCPRAAAGSWSSSAARARTSPTTRPPRLMDRLQASKPNAPSMKLFDDEAEEEHLWKVRESGLGATARIPGATRRLGGLGGLRRPARPGRPLPPRPSASCFRSTATTCSLYGHFGQGCIHTRIDFELKTDEGVKHFRKFLDEAGDLVVRYGGSISGEHGDGQSKAALLPKMFGPELVQAFGEFKAIWDPHEQDEPAQGGRPLPARTRTSGSAPPTTRRRSRRTSSSSTTTAASRTRRSAASASASAARRRAARCARATW